MNIVTAILIFGGYAYYAWGRIPEGEISVEEQLQFWAKMVLLLIPFSIVGRIVAHILWAIGYRIATGEDIPSREDERDKLIELRAMARSQWIFILSFFLGLGFIAMLKPVYLLFVTVAVGGLISDVFSEVVRMYFYRRGF
ncbi:MAG TPA: hypothetical protein DCP28_28250 [Cytophagales bacterium]|nr:hypothetical protein [Cytophagales bacterium]